MRTILRIAKFFVAAALFGFGVVIIVGFIGVLLEGPLEEPLWQHLLSVAFMGVLPILGAVLLILHQDPAARPPGKPPHWIAAQVTGWAIRMPVADRHR